MGTNETLKPHPDATVASLYSASEASDMLLNSCAYHYNKALAQRLGVSPDCFKQDIL